MNGLEWYGVRCVFHHTGFEPPAFEERVTLWYADSADAAIELAEDEARQYAENLDNVTYLEFAQSYQIAFGTLGVGTEVFSLMRTSTLEPDDYLSWYLDSGDERQRDGDE